MEIQLAQRSFLRRGSEIRFIVGRNFRQANVIKGLNRDTAWFAAIDSEWPAIQNAFLSWLNPSNFDEKGIQKVRLSDLTGPILQRRYHP